MDGLSDVQADALEQLQRYWDERDALKPLPRAAALRRTKDEGAVGWRVELPADYQGKDRHMDILLPTGFPQVAAEVWIDPNPFLIWPHAESNGKLCLWADGEAPVWLAPKDAIDVTIAQFRRTFGLVAAGSADDERAAEFAREWMSYWRIATKPTTILNGMVVCLTRPASSVCWLNVVKLERQAEAPRIIAVSDSSNELRAWIENTGLDHDDCQENGGLYIRLTQAPFEPGAPNSPEALIRFTESHAHDRDAASDRILQFLESNDDTPLWIVFEYAGRALAGLYLAPRLSKSIGQNRRRGRRPYRRRIGTKFSVVEVQRGDASWVHGRGFDDTARHLSKKHIILIGTGSLGSMLAESLATSGTGKMTLVDHGELEFANLGRHALGAADVGRNKSTALAERLQRDYPHLNVESVESSLKPTETLMIRNLAEADLVISTTANPTTELLLVGEHQKSNIQRLQICWSEPYALAGHSLVAQDRQLSLGSRFSDGEFVEPATAWNVDIEFALPGCGASHIPGAGNRIRMIASIAAEHAIDVLTDRAPVNQHRLWVSDSETVESHGGSRRQPSPEGPATVVVEDLAMISRS